MSNNDLINIGNRVDEDTRAIKQEPVLTEEAQKEALRQKLVKLSEQNCPIIYRALTMNRGGMIDYEHALLLIATFLAEENANLNKHLLKRIMESPPPPIAFAPSER